MLCIYFITLLLPVRLMHEGERRIFISGFEFKVPLGSLAFIIPIFLLVYFSKREVSKAWNVILASVNLFFCLATCVMASVSLNHGKPEPMGGCWLLILVGIGFFVICIRWAKIASGKINHPDLVDQLP